VLLLKFIFFPTFFHSTSATYRRTFRIALIGAVEVQLFWSDETFNTVIFLLALYNIESLGVSLHLISWGPLSVIGAYKCASIPLNTSDVVALSITCFSVIIRENLNCKHPAWNSCVDYPEG
jgi:hypothetical protein